MLVSEMAITTTVSLSRYKNIRIDGARSNWFLVARRISAAVRALQI
jgi:hypothetical protein